MTSLATDQEAIYSTFGADPFMTELVGLYVAEMPGRIAALEQAFASADMEALQRAAHQTKGAAGGYGFDALTPAAAAVESAVRDRQPLEKIRQALDQLIYLGRQIRAGAPS